MTVKDGLTLREKHSLRILEKRFLMRIFGPNSDEVVLIPVAERYKARVCGLLLARIAGSNPAGGMDVCLL
jgi:hypothetical protein